MRRAFGCSAQLCEPILKPVRRVIPPIGQIDFSVLWVSIAIGALLILAALNMHSYMPEITANDGDAGDTAAARGARPAPRGLEN